MAEEEREAEGPSRLRRSLVFLCALAVFGLALLVVWDTVRPAPVAANFMRVGGGTRFETAIEASRFWLDTPRRVYVIPVTAGDRTLLRAAACAIRDDAPILFSRASGTRPPKVRRLIERWRRTQEPFEVIRGRRIRTCGRASPPPDGLRTLSGNERLLPAFVPVDPRDELAPHVVFAASKTLRSPADVAVGLALAAHLAKEREVSFVVLPRYLAADARLDRQLRNDTGLVESGVVVGGAGSIPEETRVVLRQMLRSSNRSSVLASVRSAIGDLGLLIPAVAVLLASGAVASRAAAPAVDRITTYLGVRPMKINVPRQKKISEDELPDAVRQPVQPVTDGTNGEDLDSEEEQTTEAEGTPRNPFDETGPGRPHVTIHLRGRSTVRGRYQGEETIGGVTFVKLGSAEVEADEPEGKPTPADVLLVPVELVELAVVAKSSKEDEPPAESSESGAT